MNTPFHLFQLQKIDSRLTAINNRSKEITKFLNNDPVLRAAKSELDLATKEFENASKALLSIESRIQDRRNKLEQSESSLYSGKIKNPKELQDLQKEIASIKAIIAGMEDEQISMMINVEEIEKDFRKIELKVKEAEVNNRIANVDLSTQATVLTQEKARLAAERNLLVSQIPESILNKYEELRLRKGGLAVAKVEDQTCSLCGASLTPSECQSAKSPSVLFFCNSCGRILYAD